MALRPRPVEPHDETVVEPIDQHPQYAKLATRASPPQARAAFVSDTLAMWRSEIEAPAQFPEIERRADDQNAEIERRADDQNAATAAQHSGDTIDKHR